MFGAVARRVSCRLLVCIVLILLCPRGAAASSSGFVYALQTTGGPSQIYGFRLDLRTGALSLLPGFPMASGGNRNAGGNAPPMAVLSPAPRDVPHPPGRPGRPFPAPPTHPAS